MENPCFGLLHELEQRIKEVDNGSGLPLDKCSTKVNICQELILKLRKLYLDTTLETIEEQIHFFKNVKPRFFSELYYQKHCLTYYKKKPKGSVKEQTKYIEQCMDDKSRYMCNYIEFRNYINLNLTELDESFFTKRDYCPRLHGSFEYPTDPDFSSPADPTYSSLLASDRYLQFLKNEMFSLKNPSLDPSWEYMKSLEWQGSKTDLVELIYALYSSGSLKGDLKDIISVIERSFSVDLGYFYRIYTDIKLKKNPTSFLDILKTSLLAKMQSEN